MTREADIPIERGIRKPWAHADVKPGEAYPAEFVRIFCGASPWMAWDIPMLAHLRPDNTNSPAATVSNGGYLMAPAASPAAGWYADPHGAGGYRWSDGSRRTAHTRR